MLQAKNINRTIDGKDILRNLSFTLTTGEIICIIGPSGAGKTSLLRTISLLDTPSSGSLTIDKYTYTFPIQRAEMKKIPLPYPNLTVVFQQLFIWPHLTLRENIMLPLRGGVDAKHLEEVVHLFQMKEFLDRHPNEVSLGQRQRTVLARALLLKPQYLLLDEVTSALDVEQTYLILSHLKQIAEKGVGIILVTHALHLAGKISNKVLFLDKGEVVESGTSDILVHPNTARLQKFTAIAQ